VNPIHAVTNTILRALGALGETVWSSGMNCGMSGGIGTVLCAGLRRAIGCARSAASLPGSFCAPAWNRSGSLSSWRCWWGFRWSCNWTFGPAGSDSRRSSAVARAGRRAGTGPLFANLRSSCARQRHHHRVGSHEGRRRGARARSQGIEPLWFLVLPRAGDGVSAFCLTVIFVLVAFACGYGFGALTGRQRGPGGVPQRRFRAVHPVDAIGFLVNVSCRPCSPR